MMMIIKTITCTHELEMIFFNQLWIAIWWPFMWYAVVEGGGGRWRLSPLEKKKSIVGF